MMYSSSRVFKVSNFLCYAGGEKRPPSIKSCTQPHKELCRFAAGAVLTIDFICREYNLYKKENIRL